MSNMTKQALEVSLKKLLLQKPLDKITIQDLTSDCGISRMAFYYHFKDIVDKICTTMQGNIKNSIDNFTKRGE